MTAREWLGRARQIDRRIAETEERLKRMRARLEGRVSHLSGVPGSRRRWSDPVDELIDMEYRLDEQVQAMCRIKKDVMDAIEGVGDGTLREVLELYYLDNCSWAQVADKMHYTVRNVQILHGKALKFVDVPA